MDHDAFLSSIAADPCDDALRLVYADWLEERGDPRAELLRLECDLNAIATGHCPADQPKQRAEDFRMLRNGIDEDWIARVVRTARVPPVVIRCAACQIALTPRLRELPGEVWISQEDGAELVPRGCCWFASASFGPPIAGHACVNLRDLLNTKDHPDSRRRSGCCGPCGVDGVNTVCSNGHEVGTECSDCWMAHCLHFEPSAVTVQRVWEPGGSPMLGASATEIWLQETQGGARSSLS